MTNSNKIARFSLVKINAPISMGLEHDKRLMFAHDHHDRHLVAVSHQKNDWVKCVPLGWDDARVSNWGCEIPAYLLVVVAEVTNDNKMIQDTFGASTTFRQAKAKLEEYGVAFTEDTEDGYMTLYVPRWACRARYDISGELQETEAYSPAAPVSPIR